MMRQRMTQLMLILVMSTYLLKTQTFHSQRQETHCLHQNTKVLCQTINNRISSNSTIHYHDN